MSDLLGDLEKHLKKRVADSGRILLIDIERIGGTAKGLWSPKTRYIHPSQFTSWPRTVCWAAQWYDQSKMMFEAEWFDRERMLQRSWELYDQADCVVTYNGKKFDNTHLGDDWDMAGMVEPSSWKDMDLYVWARSRVGFESKSLHEVCRRLGHPGKETHYSAADVEAALEGNVAAQRRVKRYNTGDIHLTRWLYDRERHRLHTHPHVGHVGETMRCNACGSDDLKLMASKYQADVLLYPQYRCGNCGAKMRDQSNAGRVARTRGVR